MLPIYGIKSLSVNELLNDNEIEIILNLTIPKAHYEVAKKALLHNKHVYSEKPMAINLNHGKELLKLAKKKNYTLVMHQIPFWVVEIKNLKKY